MKTIADQHENNTEFIEEYQRVFNGKSCMNFISYYTYIEFYYFNQRSFLNIYSIQAAMDVKLSEEAGSSGFKLRVTLKIN